MHYNTDTMSTKAATQPPDSGCRAGGKGHSISCKGQKGQKTAWAKREKHWGRVPPPTYRNEKFTKEFLHHIIW